MTAIFDQSPGRIQITKDGAPWFDTATKTFGLVHGSAITISGQTVSFPAPHTDNAVFWEGSSLGGSPAQFFECMRAFITMLPEESGPQAIDPTYTYDLPDILLGTVPTGTDYIDTQVVITRTKAPAGATVNKVAAGILGDTIAVIPPTGVPLKLVGQSCPLEECYPLARSFAVVLVGTNVYLRRRQSVGQSIGFTYSSTNSPSQSGAYTYGTTPGMPVQMLTLNDGSSVVDGNIIESGFTWQRGQSNFNSTGSGGQSPLTDTTDYSSVYSMDFVITPGFINTSLTLAAPTSRRAIRLGDFSVSTGTGSSVTGSVPASAEETTRHILIAVATISNPTRTVSGVTVNGVAATLDSRQSNGSGPATDVSLWVVALPLGTGSLTVAVSFSGSTVLIVSVLAYALYHFTSFSNQATQATTSASGLTLGVATTAGGYVFAVCASGVTTAELSGMDLMGRVSEGNAGGLEHGFEIGNGGTMGPVIAAAGGTPIISALVSSFA